MINLLTIQAKKNIRKEYHIRLWTIMVFLASITLFVASIFLFPSYIFLFTMEKNTKDILQTAGGEYTQEYAALLSQVETTRQQLDILNTTNPVHVYEDIFLTITSKRGNIKITNLSYTQHNNTNLVIISGISPNRTSLLEFADALKEEQLFTDVEIPISNFVSQSDIEFSIEITL